MTTITFIGIGPRSRSRKSEPAWTSYRRGVASATVALPSSCPRRGRGVAYGSWHGASGRLEARRDVVDAVDADEAIDGYSEPCLGWLQLNITRQDFVGGCGTGRRRRSDVLYAIDAGGGVVADLDAWRGASITEARCVVHLVRDIISRTSDERSGYQTKRRGDYRRLS